MNLCRMVYWSYGGSLEIMIHLGLFHLRFLAFNLGPRFCSVVVKVLILTG